MKFIGQYIQSFIARFRSDVYLEDIDTGTIASGGNLGLDSNNKIVKAAETSGDLTSIVAGTGLSGTSLTGPAPTLNVNASQTQITSVGTLSGLTVDATTTNFQSNVSGPIVSIVNYGNNTTGGTLQFALDKGAAGADNDIPGGIRWTSDNDAQSQTNFGEIYIQVTESADGHEVSTMYLKIAEYDGTVTSGLTIKGTEKDGIIDVDIASGGQSTTTIASDNIIVGSLPTSDPSVAGKLWSNSGVVTVSAG